MKRSGKILAIDPDKTVLEFFKHLLFEYNVQTANTSIEALQKIDKFNPDIVLLATEMTPENGYEICKKIKKTHLTKVILTSVKVSEDTRLLSYQSSADDTIAKPFDPVGLIARIKVFLRLKKAEDDLTALNATLENAVSLRTKQLVEAEKIANKAKTYIDNIISSMIDPLIVLSLDSRIERVNSATVRLLDFTAEELIGKSMNMLTEEALFSDSEFENLIRDGFIENRPLTLIAKDKTKLPAFVSRSLIRDEEGHISGIVFVAKDMTDQKTMEQEKEIMYQQLLQASKLASIGELAAGIAHEINNPLTIIQGNADIISNYFSETNNLEYVKFVNYQLHALGRISNIVNGLRTYARIDTVELTVIDVHQILAQTITIINQIYKNDNIEIISLLQSTRPIVKGSSGRFQQVIMNLISNARDAMIEIGQAEGKIEISTQNRDNTVEVKISDNGCGIAPEKLDRIFNPFYTSKPPGKGTGLGLSIALSIINEMKGKIEVVSTLGKGTKFTLSFPTTEGTVSLQETPSYGLAATFENSRFKGRVLLADDEDAIVELMTRHLLDFGLQVESVRDGTQAMEKLKTNQYDVLITDLKMPKVDGEALIRFVRETNQGLPLKIIAMTGNLSYTESPESSAQLPHFVDYLIEKPFSKKDVYLALKELF